MQSGPCGLGPILIKIGPRIHKWDIFPNHANHEALKWLTNSKHVVVKKHVCVFFGCMFLDAHLTT